MLSPFLWLVGQLAQPNLLACSDGPATPTCCQLLDVILDPVRTMAFIHIGENVLHFSKVRLSDPDGKDTFHKLLRKKDYLAQQIAETTYTMYSMKADHNELECIFSNMDVYGCPEWVKWDIKQLAASRRRWSIRASKQVWLG